MKKQLLTFLLIPLMLTGCNNSDKTDPQAKNEAVTNVLENAISDFEKCKEKGYENLELSECSVSVPKLDAIYNVNIEFDGSFKFENNTSELENYEKYCNFFFNRYDISSALFSADEITDIETDDMYVYYPKVENYTEEIKNGSLSINFFMYRDIENSDYLSYHAGEKFPHQMNKGEAFDITKSEFSKVSSWLPSDMESTTKKVASYANDGKHDDESYMLFDGEVTIGEAVSFFENEYLSTLPCEFDSNYSLSVSRIDVYEIKEGTYGYVFKCSTAWNGIALNRGDERVSYSPNATNQYEQISEALMIRKNDVESFMNIIFPDIINEKNPIKNMVSLEKALDITSETMTKQVKFEVSQIELIYQGSYSEDYSSAHLEPTWKISTFNPNDSCYYDVYINAVSSECTYESYQV